MAAVQLTYRAVNDLERILFLFPLLYTDFSPFFLNTYEAKFFSDFLTLQNSDCTGN